ARVGVAGEEVVQFGVAAAVEDAHARRPARGGAGDDVGLAVAVDVAGRHAHAAGVGLGDAEQQGAIDAAEDLDGAAAAVGTSDDVGVAVAVDVPGRDKDAVGLAGGVGGEVTEAAGENAAVGAAVDADGVGAAGPLGGDDVGGA